MKVGAFDYVLSEGLQLLVHLDAVRIEQVVNNLLDNAVKFSPDGGRIEVELARRAAEVAADGHLAKPFELDDLFRVVDEYGATR